MNVEYLLGGFIDDLAWNQYHFEFMLEFPQLRMYRGSERLVRYWRHQTGKTVTKSDQAKIESWHRGFRAALRSWRPVDYGE